MPTDIAQETQAEVERQMKGHTPTPLEAVRVREGHTWDGEPGVFVMLVYAQSPSEPDFAQIRDVSLKVRDWLSDRNRPELFPYFSVATREDLAEESDAGS